jgi:hypothetical protein
MEVIEALTKTKRFQQLRNLLALVAAVKYGGDLLRTLRELGLGGSVAALWAKLFKAVLYYGKKIPFVKGVKKP